MEQGTSISAAAVMRLLLTESLLVFLRSKGRLAATTASAPKAGRIARISRAIKTVGSPRDRSRARQTISLFRGEVAYSMTPGVCQLLMEHIPGKDQGNYVLRYMVDLLHRIGFIKSVQKLAVMKREAHKPATTSHNSKATEIMAEKALHEIARQCGHRNLLTGQKLYVVEK